jgi:hypothetical protein
MTAIRGQSSGPVSRAFLHDFTVFGQQRGAELTFLLTGYRSVV